MLVDPLAKRFLEKGSADFGQGITETRGEVLGIVRVQYLFNISMIIIPASLTRRCRTPLHRA
jgi:hypothetical protein